MERESRVCCAAAAGQFLSSLDVPVETVLFDHLRRRWW